MLKSGLSRSTLLAMEEVHDEVYRDDLGLLTPDDIAFVHGVIGHDLLSADELNRLLNEATLRRQVLDSPAIYEAVVSDLTRLNISEFFYYSIIVRQAMLAAGLESQDYTENVAASLVRMASLQRKSLNRLDSPGRYRPVNLHIMKESGEYGSHIRIYSRMEPYEMLLEGFVVDVGAYSKAQ
jgi:hypothetical protein